MRSIPLVLVVLATISVGAQSGEKPVIPRMPDGHADLQGTWDFAQLTPFERPGEFAGKSSITDEEAEEFAERRIETTNKDRRDGGAAAVGIFFGFYPAQRASRLTPIDALRHE